MGWRHRDFSIKGMWPWNFGASQSQPQGRVVGQRATAMERMDWLTSDGVVASRDVVVCRAMGTPVGQALRIVQGAGHVPRKRMRSPDRRWEPRLPEIEARNGTPLLLHLVKIPATPRHGDDPTTPSRTGSIFPRDVAGQALPHQQLTATSTTQMQRLPRGS